jgi:nitrous oxide reductase accessory protein NosL
MKLRLVLGVPAVLIAAGILAQAAEIMPAKPGVRDKCPVCGMFVAKYPDWLAQVAFQDGTRVFFDGVKDLMKYYFAVSQYSPGKKAEDIQGLWVTDYYSLTPIDGREAYYVQGSDVYGPMGRELIPFRDEAAAREFLKDHQGKVMLRFHQITPEIIKSLD